MRMLNKKRRCRRRGRMRTMKGGRWLRRKMRRRGDGGGEGGR